MEGKAPLTSIANLGVALKRALELRLPTSRESLPIDMLVSDCLPYEASKTYRIMRTESACMQAENIAEAQRSLRRL